MKRGHLGKKKTKILNFLLQEVVLVHTEAFFCKITNNEVVWYV